MKKTDLVILSILCILLSKPVLANLSLSVLSPRPVTKMQLALCKNSFSQSNLQKYHELENSKTHYITAQLNFVYDKNLNVAQVRPSKKPAYWPNTQNVDKALLGDQFSRGSHNWNDSVLFDSSNSRVYEWNEKNEFFKYVSNEHLGFWKQRSKDYIRQRKDFDFKTYAQTVNRLPPQRTKLYAFGQNSEHLVFRIYDSSILLNSLEGNWGMQKRATDKSLAEWKYFEDIPEFKKLVEKNENIIAVEGFAATKKWNKPQHTIYHELAKYIDETYNENLYRLLNSFHLLRKTSPLVISIVPEGLSSVIHRDLKFKYLSDETGRKIITKDGYEIIYTKATDIVEKFLFKAQVPILKGDFSGQEALADIQAVENTFRRNFQREIELIRSQAKAVDNLWPKILELREQSKQLGRENIASEIYPDSYKHSSAMERKRLQLTILEQRMTLMMLFKGSNGQLPEKLTSLNDLAYLLSGLYMNYQNLK